MKDMTRHAAETLFARPAMAGSNAAKLESIRLKQAIRTRRLKIDERRERLAKRAQKDAIQLFSRKAGADANG